MLAFWKRSIIIVLIEQEEKKQKEDEDDCFDKHGIISPFTQSCAPYGRVELLHRISKGNNSFSGSKWSWRDGFKKHFWGVSGH